MEAEPLLALDDPGLVPWITLMHTDRPPLELLQRCRDIIDRKADPVHHEQLNVVAHVLGNLVYNEDILKAIFGGKDKMIESPILKEIVEETAVKTRVETTQTNILGALQARYGAVPEQLTFDVRAVRDMSRLNTLFPLAITCTSLNDFRARM